MLEPVSMQALRLERSLASEGVALLACFRRDPLSHFDDASSVPLIVVVPCSMHNTAEG
jgi:hypothetical protein